MNGCEVGGCGGAVAGRIERPCCADMLCVTHLEVARRTLASTHPKRPFRCAVHGDAFDARDVRVARTEGRTG